MNSLAGHLLIAAPGMADDFFSLTVVLLFQHSDEGAVGVILNKPSDVCAHTVWDEIHENNPHANAPINIGGPCQGPLMAVHNSLAFAEVPVIPGVALSFESDNLRKLIQQPEQSIRLFSGYSGWAPEQLENEICQGGWYTIPARPHLVFKDPTEMWRDACARYGDDILTPIAGSHIPSDPSRN